MVTLPSASITQPPPTPRTAHQTFDIQRLLPELRILVWEATLPGPRVFHVRGTFRLWDGCSSPESATNFHVGHRPPVILFVCRESRAVALHKGMFFGMNSESWFNPESDILYFDKNSKSRCLAPGLESPMPIRNWDKVLNVGVEWRAFFNNIPRAQSDRGTRAIWRSVIHLLQRYMPGMRRLHYVLPMVRHPGGLVWGREPYGSPTFQAELVALPGTTKVPWGNGLILNTPSQLPGGAAGAMIELLDLREDQLIPWNVVKRGIQLAMDECEAERAHSEDADWMVAVDKQKVLPMPEIVGRWLVRPNAHYDEEVHTFVT